MKTCSLVLLSSQCMRGIHAVVSKTNGQNSMQLTIYLFSVYTNMIKYGITIMSLSRKYVTLSDQEFLVDLPYSIAITLQELSCERDNSPQILESRWTKRTISLNMTMNLF